MTNIMNSKASRKELSHARIVEVAARAIRRAGYRGVGVADIMKEAGLTHGGFYAHFASRDALVVEALQRAGQDTGTAMRDAVARLVARGLTPLAALVTAYLHDTHLDRVEDGCVVAALASESNRQGETIRHEAAQRVADLTDLVRSTLPSSADPAQAELLTATLVGTLQLARTLGGQAGRELLARTRKALIQRPAVTAP